MQNCDEFQQRCQCLFEEYLSNIAVVRLSSQQYVEEELKRLTQPRWLVEARKPAIYLSYYSCWLSARAVENGAGVSDAYALHFRHEILVACQEFRKLAPELPSVPYTMHRQLAEAIELMAGAKASDHQTLRCTAFPLVMNGDLFVG